ncbi:MAG: multicopper oxidase domain-containing protein [Chloroflexi bacterium]|nr:multicopper oxidase domain-containing protein [Chloroflexota bacterium]
MSFPAEMPARQRRVLIAAGFLIVLVVAAVFAVLAVYALDGGDGAEAQTVREYNLEVVPADIDYGGGNIWHAWTYKLADAPAGTVPGPTLTVTVGEKLVVHVKNNLDLVHSLHTHLSNYDQESDGSQANIISGKGAGAMIPPGGEWTYEFEPTEPGIFFYHCHSADGELMITQHIHQGLYGAIIVKAPDEPPVRDEVIFMSEIGHETEGDNIPPFIMNGLGLPGGEHTLEAAFRDGGFDAVAAQLNKTVPAISAKTGEEMRVSVFNIGDQIHSFHAHSVNHFSEQAMPGRIWPNNVLPLVPGAADTLRFTFTKPGLWLFHCHVVAHADAGMIGLFIIEEGQPPGQQ